MKILAIGAHPDDLEIYMFGLLSIFKERGDNVITMIATDGAAGSKKFDSELKNKRYREALLGLKKINKPIFLDESDGNLFQSKHIHNLLQDNFSKINPDLIITHSPKDYHPDHRYLSQYVSDIASFRYPVLLADTFLGVNFLPNYYVDITKFYQPKIDAINCHKSQNPTNYAKVVKIWNSFRAAQCNSRSGRYAEAYRVDCKFPFSDIRSLLPISPKIQPTSLIKSGGLV